MKKILAAIAVIIVAGSAIVSATDAPLTKQNLAALISCAGKPTPTLAQYSRDAVSEDSGVAESAIRALRVQGPEGLRALLEAHAETLKQHNSRSSLFGTKTNDAAWLRLKAAIDGVGQQRDCYASQLYWFTDFEQAKAAAKAGGKPILSLRLLGKLDEEFSCANSRFFRTTLYANKEVANFLRDHYVLHWKSVRPVPKVTIDFGDGRKLEQTITGNSIHYVLDADGEVMDALPGLYAPKIFLRELERGEKVTQESAKLASAERESFLREFHRARLTALNAELAADLQQINHSVTSRTELTPTTLVQAVANAPDARAASRTTGAKRQIEQALLRPTAPKSASFDDAIWQKIAALHADSAKLDENSRVLIQAKAPTAFAASLLVVSKTLVESPLLRQIRNLERSLSEDTARNEYLFHTQIHEWLASGTAPAQVDALNAKIYAELFLTPDSDPWLGLLPNDAYAALENDGIVLTTKK